MRLIGISGRLETTIWVAAAAAVVVLLVASSVGGVGSRLQGLLIAVPFVLILRLTAVRRRRRTRSGALGRRRSD